jgi:hypothetical protein
MVLTQFSLISKFHLSEEQVRKEAIVMKLAADKLRKNPEERKKFLKKVFG